MKLPRCSITCAEASTPCTKDKCKHWIDYKKEHNCSLVSIYLNGQMTLRDVAERLGISFSRVKQIETKALRKLREICSTNSLF